ncbi:IniB N-terminal domain-containing protein [Micromonospora sp. NPDC048930]|uniref:IniB N-terminal domain-containing protein n=1 Tax=Micromonospora sp. NPDC048930 TaxID=3364261 RepID=UPI003721131C
MDSQQSLHAESHQTLHDFVLNLLTDPDARSAFDLDPEGALQAAGLTDVTAADVQDVVPLVVDYAPGAGLGPLAPAVGQLGFGPLVDDTTYVAGQLQAVPQQISVNTSQHGVDATAGALGVIAVDPAGGYAGAAVLPGIGLGVGPGGLGTDLAGVHDVAHTLDVDVVSGVDAAVDPAVGDVAGTVANPLGTTDGVLHGDVLGGDLGVLPGTQTQVGGLVDSLGVDDTLGGLGVGDVGSPAHVPATVDGVTQQVDGTISGVTGTVGGLTGGITHSVTGDATVAHGDTSVGGEVHASSDGGLLGGLL